MFALTHGVHVPSLCIWFAKDRNVVVSACWLLMFYVVCIVYSPFIESTPWIQISIENSSFIPVSSELGRWLNPRDKRPSVTEGRGIVKFRCVVQPVEFVCSLLAFCKVGKCAGTFLNRRREFSLLAVLLCVPPSLQCVSFYIPFFLVNLILSVVKTR